MAVTLSSDLIADVMRNAEPARLKVAAAKLQNLEKPAGAPAAFANIIDGMAPAPDTAHPSVNQATSKTTNSKAPGPYVEFEQMVLRNLFETLLPKAESGAFGTGPSAGIWRSMAADEFASLYASSGGIGIASALSSEESDTKTAQWPYFSADKIEAFTG